MFDRIENQLFKINQSESDLFFCNNWDAGSVGVIYVYLLSLCIELNW